MRCPPPASRDIAIWALVYAACAASPQLYEGPARDRSEIAVLSRQAGGDGDLRVFRIDQTHAGGYEWHLLPGPHRVWVELVQFGSAMNTTFKAWSYCALEFDAEAGGSYRILSENDQEMVGRDTAVTLGVRIVDGAGQLVGSPTCSDKRPRFDK
jgi:hypothetical protein